MKINKIILVRHRDTGKYGHAIHQEKAGIGRSYRVRLLEDYGVEHTLNIPSFHLSFEVMDDVEE